MSNLHDWPGFKKVGVAMGAEVGLSSCKRPLPLTKLVISMNGMGISSLYLKGICKANLNSLKQSAFLLNYPYPTPGNPRVCSDQERSQSS